MARFTQEMARSNDHYIALYTECRDLLKTVHRFEFVDVVETLGFEAWAAHIKWAWIRDWLERDLGIITEPTEVIVDGEVVIKDKPVKIEDPSDDEPVRKLNPLAQPFFNLQKKVYDRHVKRAKRTGENGITQGAELELARLIVPDPENSEAGERATTSRTKNSLYVSECYATAKKVRGYCDDLYHGGFFADRRKALAEENILGKSRAHDVGVAPDERILPVVSPTLKLAAAKRAVRRNSRALKAGNE